jgi:hypothetical protein
MGTTPNMTPPDPLPMCVMCLSLLLQPIYKVLLEVLYFRLIPNEVCFQVETPLKPRLGFFHAFEKCMHVVG